MWSLRVKLLSQKSQVNLIPQGQVWSLTQFYDVNFLQAQITEKGVFLSTFKVCISCLNGTSGTSEPHLTASLILRSCGSNDQSEVEGP